MTAHISSENQSNFYETYQCREFEKDDDLSRFVSVINDAYRCVRVIKKDSSRITMIAAKELLENHNNKIFVCLTPNNEICGTAVLTLKKDSNSAVLGLLSVAPSEQGKGLGPILINHVEKEAKKLFVNRIKLFVIPLFQERLIRFYMSKGYEKTEKTVPFADQHKNLIKQKYLEKVHFAKFNKNII